MRDQAINSRRGKARRRNVKAASSAETRAAIRKRGGGSLRWVLRVIPMMLYLTVLILTVWLLYYSLTSPYFAVHDVAVSGNRLLDPEEARKASGAVGRNLLLLNSDDIQQSLLNIAVVREAQASLSFPGRVDIGVTERTPLVQWQAREGSFLVDKQGVVFSREATPIPVIVVRDLDGPSLEIGARVDVGVISAIESLAASLPQRGGLIPSSFDYSRSSGISVPIQGGPRLIFGDANDLDSKLNTLAAVREHLDASKARAEVIDLRFKGRPVYTLAAASPAKQGQGR